MSDLFVDAVAPARRRGVVLQDEVICVGGRGIIDTMVAFIMLTHGHFIDTKTHKTLYLGCVQHKGMNHTLTLR